MFFTCKSFMFSDFTWKKNVCLSDQSPQASDSKNKDLYS